MSEKSEALIGLIDGYLAKKNHLPANAIKEELKRVKELEDALRGIIALEHTESNEWDAFERVIPEMTLIATKALGETNG